MDQLHTGVYKITDDIQFVIPPDILDSMSKAYLGCFGLDVNSIGFHYGADVYILAEDPEYRKVVAVVVIDPNINVLPWEKNPDVAQWNIYNVCTAPEYQGKGIMTEFLGRVLEFIRIADSDVLNEFYLEVYPDNARAKKVYEKIGFQKVSEYFDRGRNVELMLSY
jgi:RimJ/RimL family protein N-acetyltransferase